MLGEYPTNEKEPTWIPILEPPTKAGGAAAVNDCDCWVGRPLLFDIDMDTDDTDDADDADDDGDAAIDSGLGAGLGGDRLTALGVGVGVGVDEAYIPGACWCGL